jgi:hypothetical protein
VQRENLYFVVTYKFYLNAFLSAIYNNQLESRCVSALKILTLKEVITEICTE